MAMGQKQALQAQLFVTHAQLSQGLEHPFYAELERTLVAAGFDRFAEQLCAPAYAAPMGRPSIPPGIYFRCLFVGYFEGIRSERGIAWRVSDSLSLRSFLGVALGESTPDHSTLSRTRKRLSLPMHQQVFEWVLARLGESGLVCGRTVGMTQLLRRRGELVERPFAHRLERGRLRRVHVRGLANVQKQELMLAAAQNLSLLLRQNYGAGTPRQSGGEPKPTQQAATGLLGTLWVLLSALWATLKCPWRTEPMPRSTYELTCAA